MLRAVRVEILKLKGSLALLILTVVPILIGVIVLLSMMSNPRTPTWHAIFQNFAFPLWTFFLLPMALAAFATLLGNMEHRSGIWEHWLALPVRRWHIYAAKCAAIIAATIAMTALMGLSTVAAAIVAGTLSGRMPTGSLDAFYVSKFVGLISASALMLAVVQLWAALRFANFVVPLALGIGGTLVSIAVAMTRTTYADYFPWTLPVRIVTTDHPVEPALAGGVGGMILAVLMVLELQRRR